MLTSPYHSIVLCRVVEQSNVQYTIADGSCAPHNFRHTFTFVLCFFCSLAYGVVKSSKVFQSTGPHCFSDKSGGVTIKTQHFRGHTIFQSRHPRSSALR